MLMIVLVIGMAGSLLGAGPNSMNWYEYYSRLGIVRSASVSMDSAAVETLMVVTLDGMVSSNDYPDSLAEQHAATPQIWTLAVKVDSVDADSAIVDSLWWNFWSASGSGPMVNADGSSTVIKVGGSGNWQWSPIIVPRQWKLYPLFIPRGQGRIYLIGRAKYGGVVGVEVWGGR